MWSVELPSRGSSKGRTRPKVEVAAVRTYRVGALRAPPGFGSDGSGQREIPPAWRRSYRRGLNRKTRRHEGCSAVCDPSGRATPVRGRHAPLTFVSWSLPVQTTRQASGLDAATAGPAIPRPRAARAARREQLIDTSRATRCEKRTRPPHSTERGLPSLPRGSSLQFGARPGAAAAFVGRVSLARRLLFRQPR